MEKQYSARDSGILQPFNKNHVSLNRPHRVEAIDTLTIDIAIAASLHHRAENLAVRNRYSRLGHGLYKYFSLYTV